MKIPNLYDPVQFEFLSLARIVSEDSQPDISSSAMSHKSSKDS